MDGSLEVVDYVVIRNQKNTHEQYDGLMEIPLWLWTPGGRPIHSWLESGATLLTEAGDTGEQVVILEADYRGVLLRCQLDPDHDWLPMRIWLGEGHEFRVARFGRDNGRWFPVEGVSTMSGSEIMGAKQTGFSVTKLRINRPIQESMFSLPSLSEGSLVNDLSGGKSYIKGGEKARERLLSSAETTPLTSDLPRIDTNLAASRTPYLFPWSVVLVLMSAITFIIAWIFRRR